jgi:hypothetical protein
MIGLEDRKTPIEVALFILEGVAHLQGREHDILPIVDAARIEYQQLLRGCTNE